MWRVNYSSNLAWEALLLKCLIEKLLSCHTFLFNYTVSINTACTSYYLIWKCDYYVAKFKEGARAWSQRGRTKSYVVPKGFSCLMQTRITRYHAWLSNQNPTNNVLTVSAHEEQYGHSLLHCIVERAVPLAIFRCCEEL